MRRFALLVSILGGAAWHFGWEMIRAWLYEQGFHVVNPYLFGISLSWVLHYGITVALVALGLWLFWKTGSKSPSPARGEYSGWTNTQLRDRVKAVADGIRELESTYSGAKSLVRMAPAKRDATAEEKLEVWHAGLAEDTRLSNEMGTKFRNQYLAEARSLRAEILRRGPDIVGSKPGLDNPFGRGAGILQGGMLSGPRPITYAADYLDSLARTLP